MPAPTEYPDWATDETNNVEPPDGKKAEGWIPAEEPPSSWFNWWQWIVGLWVRWLDSQVIALFTRVDTADANTVALAAAAALKASQNTFTKAQIINTEGSVADEALVTTTAKPGDDPEPGTPPFTAGTNRWKLILDAPTQGGARAGIFVGQSPWGAALVNNARWHVPTQKWRQLDDGYASTAMVGRSGQYITSYVPAGSPPWSDWPTDGGGDFISGGNLAANGGGGAGKVLAKSAFEYVAVLQRTTFIPIFSGNGDATVDFAGSRWHLVFVAGGTQVWAIKLPQGASMTGLDVLASKAGSGTMTAQVFRHDNHDFEEAGAGFYTEPNVGSATTTATGEVKLFVSMATQNFDNAADDGSSGSEWFLRLTAGDPNDAVYAIRVTWGDPGPRNH